MDLYKNDIGSSSTDWLWRIAPQPVQLGYGSVRGNWLDARRLIYDHQLFCISQGGPVEIVIDGNRRIVERDQFLIIPPGKWHTRRNLSSQPAQRAWVHFNWTFQAGLTRWPVPTYEGGDIRRHELRPRPAWIPDVIFLGTISRPAEFFERHRLLNEMFNEGNASDRLKARSVLLELLLELLTPVDDSNPPDGGDEPAYRIRDELVSIAAEPFSSAPSIKQRLAESGQSYDHQARLFKKAFGITPLQYVNSLRMARARQLIAETDWTVQEVAAHLGFRDLTYFDRLFKKQYLATPSQLRKRDSKHQ